MEIDRTEEGAVVRVNGEIRATFVGDLDRPAGLAALRELVRELFGEELPPAIGSMKPGDLT